MAKSTVRQYLVGPRFTARSDRVDIFGHGLFGSSTGDAGPDFSGFSDSGLTFGGGGGVDVRVSRGIAVRAQYDRLGSLADILEDNSRFAVGRGHQGRRILTVRRHRTVHEHEPGG